MEMWTITPCPFAPFEAQVAQNSAAVNGDFYLQLQDNYWYLHCKSLRQKITIDFNSAHYQYRGGKEYLLKAIKGVAACDIGDWTGGLGRDAWLLAYRGANVSVYEKNPYLYALLQQALFNAAHNETARRIQLKYGDATQISAAHQIIYLDPMYPPRKKSAKVKKGMQILQRLCAESSATNHCLLARAQECAARRVVVKRPKDADFMAQKKADIIISAPNTRYDVYLIAPRT